MNELNFEPDLNGLNKETLYKALLQYNYMPKQHDHKEELPQIFSSERFLPDVADQLLEIKARYNMGYDLLTFRRTRHPNIPRMMAIPHPRAYVELANVIAENWGEISKVCQSVNSQLEFGLHDDGRLVVQRYDHVSEDGEIEEQDPLSDFGRNYQIKTDINNFFHSVYSHSLPWALVGHTEAKRHKRDRGKWYNKIDSAVMLCQRNETKGIPIGPATSNILSEIILYKVDEVLRKSYHFTRYIDDYTAYLEDRDEGNQFLIKLSKELESYALSLNLKKTFVSQMPVPSREGWVTEINLYLGVYSDAEQKLSFKQLKLIIDKAIALSKEFPDGSVIKYAFSAIIQIGIDNTKTDAAERYFEDALLRYAYYYPTLIPLIQRWLASTSSDDPRVEDSVKKRLVKLLERSFELAQSDNIVWSIYYLLQVFGETQKGLPQKCCDLNDAMVVLMGYVYAKKKGLPLQCFATWAENFGKGLQDKSLVEYDLDRFWLVLYQLYFDGVVKSPIYINQNDKRIFEILKKNKVSFVDFEHSDFGRRSSIFAQKLFGNIDGE